MAINKYCNLYGQNKIKDEYTKINNGFELVQNDVNPLLTSESDREIAETQREINEVARQLRYSNTKHYAEYSPTTIYHTNNIVSFGGSSYMLKENSDGSILESQGYAPPTYPQNENDRWRMIGKKGDKGDTGTVPDLQVGTVTTLLPGNPVTVTRQNGSPNETPVFNFAIPRGQDGAGVGDMVKTDYDSNNDGVVNDSDKLGGQLPAYYAKESDLSDLNDSVQSHLSETKQFAGKKYQINNPYKDGGTLHLKGQMHCHTTNSVYDPMAVTSPIDLVTAYKNAGYNFITITDHNFPTPNPNVSGITWIGSGTEESAAREVIVYDTNETLNSDVTNGRYVSTSMILDYNYEKSRLMSIPHPALNDIYNIDKFELQNFKDFSFTEVYNSLAQYTGEQVWDNALSNSKKVFAFAVDDCHDINSPNQFNKGWIIVHTNVNDKENIWNNIRNGNFYSSTGNDITVTVQDNVITVTSTSSSNFEFIKNYGVIAQQNNGITVASYTIKGDEVYIRIKSTRVSDGKCAWSNPIHIDIIGGDNREKFADTRLYTLDKRQELINGNFDIWQRGTLLLYSAPSAAFLADRWGFYANANGGTLPTITLSKQSLTSGELPNSSNYIRLNFNGDGIGFGTAAGGGLYQTIENGTRKLCGTGKTVTVSFWAKSDISDKKIGAFLIQNYGTGGPPTTQEIINGQHFTLSNTWKKYTITFVTNSLKNKVFGTNDNDYINLTFYTFWSTGNCARVGDTVAETKGNGNVDITQVQLCQGEFGLPFQYKDFPEELRDCQRYYIKWSGADLRTPVSSVTTSATVDIFQQLPVSMRIAPVVSLGGTRGVDWALQSLDGANNSTGTFSSYSLDPKVLGIRFTGGTYTIKEPLNIVLATNNGYISANAEI